MKSMDKSELPKFIESNLKRGLSPEEIKQQLLIRGFFDYDIEEAFQSLHIKEFSEEETEKPALKKVESMEGWDENLPKTEETQN